MVRITVLICTLVLFLGGCTPSPLYTVERRSKSGAVRSSGDDGEMPLEKKPPPGTIIKGVASFYADDFHGKKTSNGVIYDMHGLTAAHKTLPFNTWLEVRNLANNRTVIVRVNDRGPFVDGRIIDLSYGAAKELHMLGTGLQEVEIEVLR